MGFTIDHFLSRNDGGAHVLAHARLLRKLDRLFTAALPGALRRVARVANYRSGTVVIHAEHSAAASKIRQLGQRLCAEMAKCGAECNALEVKVQPAQLHDQSSTCTLKPLSGAACGSLEEVAAKLPDGPLQRALRQLIARAAKA